MGAELPPDLYRGERVLVSACLLGEEVRYDGGSKHAPVLLRALEAAGAVPVPVCPEVLGGLGVPRPAAEIRGGDGEAVLAGTARVCTVEEGRDCTEAFLAGARAACAAAREHRIRYAFLQRRSPSCGPVSTHADGGLVSGPGVAAAALRRAGVRVIPAGE